MWTTRFLLVLVALLSLVWTFWAQTSPVYDDYAFVVDGTKDYVVTMADVEVLFASYRDKNVTGIEVRFYLKGNPLMDSSKRARADSSAQTCVTCQVGPSGGQKFCMECPVGRVPKCGAIGGGCMGPCVACV